MLVLRSNFSSRLNLIFYLIFVCLNSPYFAIETTKNLYGSTATLSLMPGLSSHDKISKPPMSSMTSFKVSSSSVLSSRKSCFAFSSLKLLARFLEIGALYLSSTYSCKSSFSSSKSLTSFDKSKFSR